MAGVFKTKREKIIERVKVHAKEMVPTGTMHFFGDGTDEDWLVLLDPWSGDVEDVLDLMDMYAELGGSGPEKADPDSVGDGWRSYKTDKFAGEDGEVRPLNFILCVDTEFYQKMKRATEHVKRLVDSSEEAAKMYRNRETRVRAFRSIVGR